jgi:Ca-activated chloride channel homolog
MSRSRIVFLLIIGTAILVVVIVQVLFPSLQLSPEDRGATATAAFASASATGTAQFARDNQVTIRVVYGTEKRGWLEDAAARFMQQNPNIVVELVGEGSMESYQSLSQLDDRSATYNGRDPIPTLWSPASSLQVNLLNGESNVRLGRDLAIECQSLVLSPLVIVGWKERVDTFEAFYNDQGGLSFRNLYAALDPSGDINGNWDALGGSFGGLIKLGYTNPQRSNSGVMMLVALANGYFDRSNPPVTSSDVTTPDFVAFLRTISNAVSQPLRDSTGDLMRDFIAKGAASYDFLIVYEALAIEYYDAAVGRQRQNLRVIYPEYTLYSDHPQCVVDHPSISAIQRSAAEQFQQFLLSEDIQRLALTYGYRPADLKIPIFGANTAFDNPDLQAAGIGAVNFTEIVEPAGATINDLITVWQRNFEQ